MIDDEDPRAIRQLAVNIHAVMVNLDSLTDERYFLD